LSKEDFDKFLSWGFLNKTKEIFKFIKRHNYAGDIMVTEKEDIRITFRLDQPLREAIESVAAKTGESSSNVIRWAIMEYITGGYQIERKQPKVERITIRLEEAYRKKLDEISDKTGKPISELVREAINWSLGKVTVPIPKEEIYRLIRKQSNAEGVVQKTLDDYAKLRS